MFLVSAVLDIMPPPPSNLGPIWTAWIYKIALLTSFIMIYIGDLS